MISAVQYNLKWVLWPLWNQGFGRVFGFFENQVASFFSSLHTMLSNSMIVVPA